ncbi:tetratricopeptide repeat protein [Thalassoroseus pseudoceratinae]|uniref:tetratricopeptide repeat protein n=1 Tax=Thalassoroseus pseudoceratinae TaxID=2713176 RepID=UPI00141DF2E4|nr:tetratricopeptide repeat protein [Thalassoroseus pseudoceratinae]
MIRIRLTHALLGVVCLSAGSGCVSGPGMFGGKPQTSAERELLAELESSENLSDPSTLHLKYARWRESVGDAADARKSYEFALENDAKSVDAILGLARLDQLADRTADAEANFQRAYNLRPDSAQTQHAWGQFLVSQQRWQEGLPLLKSAMEAELDNKSYRYRYGLALVQSGDIDVGFPLLASTVGTAEAHYNVGYVLHEQGQTDLAIARFRQALALKPTLEPAARLMAELTGDRRYLAGFNTGKQSTGIVQSGHVTESRESGQQVFDKAASRAPQVAMRPQVVPDHRQQSMSRNHNPQEAPRVVNADHSQSAPSAWYSRPETKAAAQTPPNGMTALQAEQWRNQQVMQ